MENKNQFNFFEYHTQISRDDVILSYKGPITDILLSEFSRDIRQKLQHNRKVGKKVFAVFMELAQNVLYYSKEINYFRNMDKVGTIVIIKDDEFYTLITGNMVYNSSVPLLLEKAEKVNSLNREELREYKRELRQAPSEGESKGAGIGLVQAALTSNNPLRVQTKRIDEQYAFFVLSVQVRHEDGQQTLEIPQEKI